MSWTGRDTSTWDSKYRNTATSSHTHRDRPAVDGRMKHCIPVNFIFLVHPPPSSGGSGSAEARELGKFSSRSEKAEIT